ncbi:hypothetical protein [Enterococcus avium]|uniref:hypothetical protein n=1 Tax=Enterococcus avium TaxID=33945 RepID=UPI003D0B5CC9
MKNIVAYRIYRWDQANQVLLDRVSSCIGDAELIVLADESNGYLPVPEKYTTIRYTKNMEAYHLPSGPENNCLWWNVDYGLYVLKEKVAADFYWMLDHDVILPSRFYEIIEDVEQNQADFVASHLRRASENWRWYKTGELMEMDEEMRAALLMIFGVSKRGIDALYQERLRIWQLLKEEPSSIFPKAKWPFCEVLLPNILKESAGFKTIDLLNYRPDFDFSEYRVAHAKSFNNEKLYTETSFVHPVLTPDKALTRLRRLTPYHELFDEKSTLRALITEIMYEGKSFFSDLYNYYKDQGMSDYDEQRLLELARKQKWN